MVGKVRSRPDIKRYLTIGMKLSGMIRFGPDDEHRFHCSFIGMKDKQYLIFELGQKCMEELITRRTKDADVVIKGVADTEFGHIIAFRSQIIGIKPLTGWLMFVRYPVRTEIRQIRENKRLKVDIRAVLKLDKLRVSGKIVDLSISGCGVLVTAEPDIEIGAEVQIEPAIKHLPKTIPKCRIVNIRKGAEGTLLGIAFDHPVEVTEQLRLEVFEQVILQHELVG